MKVAILHPARDPGSRPRTHNPSNTCSAHDILLAVPKMVVLAASASSVAQFDRARLGWNEGVVARKVDVDIEFPSLVRCAHLKRQRGK